MRWFIGLIVVLTGCPKGPGAPDAAVTDDFDAELRQVIARFGDSAQANDQDLELRRIRAALRQGRLAINRDVLAACLASDEGSVLTRPYRLRSAQWPTGACAGLWIGKTPNGAACDTSLACAEGVCSRSSPNGCGVCAPPGLEGAPCVDASTCAEGLECRVHLGPPVTAVCATPALGDMGELCPCRPGWSCQAGHCSGELPAGATCSSDGECVAPLRCMNFTCGLIDEGGACMSQGFCRAGAACRRPDPLEPGQWLLTTVGQCITGAAGLRCSTDAECATGLVCGFNRWRGLCVAKAAAGAACEYANQCPKGFTCHGGACRPLVGPGDTCGATAACMSGSQCAAGRCSRLPRTPEPCAGTCNGATCVSGSCVRTPGASCLGALDACGERSACLQGCTTAVATAASCRTGEVCESGGFCDDGRCQAACVLGDGRATDDFFGAVDASVPSDPCLPTGPAEVVIPLTVEQGQCVFSNQPQCVGCHTISGCYELRPRFAPPPPGDVNTAGLAARCGVDAGR